MGEGNAGRWGLVTISDRFYKLSKEVTEQVLWREKSKAY